MSRDAILARLGPHPGPSLPETLPAFTTPEQRAQRFRSELERVGGVSLGAADFVSVTAGLLNESGGARILWESAGLACALGLAVETAGEGEWYESHHPDGSFDQPLSLEPASATKEMAAAADLSIGTADWGIADTGSVVQSAHKGSGRALAVLAPIHLAVLPKEKLLGTAAEFFALDPPGGSLQVIVTGPSRTADIEKMLILGVHGPKVFGVVLI